MQGKEIKLQAFKLIFENEYFGKDFEFKLLTIIILKLFELQIIKVYLGKFNNKIKMNRRVFLIKGH